MIGKTNHRTVDANMTEYKCAEPIKMSHSQHKILIFVAKVSRCNNYNAYDIYFQCVGPAGEADVGLHRRDRPRQL